MTARDMSQRDFDAALAKHGIDRPPSLGNVTRRVFGADYYDVGDGLSVPVPVGASRRAILAHLLKSQRDHRERLERVARAVARRDELIGGKRDGEMVGVTYDGAVFDIRYRDLTVVECAAVVLALRAVREAAGRTPT